MTKSTLFDRLNHELEAFGKKAQAALEEGKLQIELLRLRRRLDAAARDLGLLVHRRERGGETEPRRFDALMLRLDDLAGGGNPTGKADRRGTAGRRLQDPHRRPAAEVRADDQRDSRTSVLSDVRRGTPGRGGEQWQPGSGPGSCRIGRPPQAEPSGPGRRSRLRSRRSPVPPAS